MAEQTDNEVCSICLNDYQQPVILDCQHSFCFICLEDYINKTSTNDQFHCPLYGCIYVGKVDVQRFKPKLNIDDNSTSTIPQCDVCTEDTSQYFCRDCDQYLCNSCKTTHNKLKSCKDHVVCRYDENQIGQQSRPSGIKKGRTQVTNHNDFCPHHERKKVTMYCKDCSLAMCWKCFVSNHNGHNYLDLQVDEVRQNIRQDLTTLNDELETQITRLQIHYDNLSSKLIEVKNFTKTACDKVDAQVDKICLEFRKTGENIKKEMQKTSEHTESKLAKSKEEIKRLTEDLKASVKYSENILEDSSIVQVLQRLPKVRHEKDESSCRKLDIPDVRYSTFQAAEIPYRYGVTTLLGKIVSCHPNMIEDIFYVEDDNEFHLCMEPTIKYYGYEKKQYLVSSLTWSIIACSDGSSLDLNLYLDDVEDESVRPYDFDVTCKVINKIDDRQSVVKQFVDHLYPDYSGHDLDRLECYDVIDLVRLRNPDSGFIDDNGNFTIQVIINPVTKK